MVGCSTPPADEGVAATSGDVVVGMAEGVTTLTITDGVYVTTAVVHVLAVGADNMAWDVIGLRDPVTNTQLPGHLILLARSGIYIIENLQLEFGIDETGDEQADRFDPAPDPAEMAAAVAARIYLLVRSVHPVAGYRDERSYTLGRTQVEAPRDGYFRRVMQTTVLLRNRGISGR